MKKVLEIFRVDWQRIFHSKTAMLLIVALMILPSLYAWFNIKALWDPYNNTSGIKVAVANDDTGTTVRGKEVNLGDELVEKLKENDSLGWTFVSKEDADKGVKLGTYYASIYIPSDFSEKLASILEEKPEKPEVTFTVNDKINAITPKITATGANTIIQQISSEFVKTVSEELLNTFDDVGIELEKDLPSIRRLEAKLFEARELLPEVNEIGGEILDMEEKFPTIKEKVQTVSELTLEYLPLIDDASASVLKFEDSLPLLNRVGSQVLVVQENISELEKIAEVINHLNDNFDTVETTVNEGITEATQALEVIQTVEEYLPAFKELGEHASGYVDTANSLVNAFDESSDTITDSIRLGLQTVNQVAGTTYNLSTALEGLDAPQQKEVLQQLSSQLQTANTVIDRQITLLETINNNLSSPVLSSVIEQLESLQTAVQKEQSLVNTGIQILEESPNNFNGYVKDIEQSAEKLYEASGGILSKYDSEILPSLQIQLTQLKEDLSLASSTISGLKEELPRVEAILTSTEGTLNNAIDVLSTFQASLPELKSTLNHATELINENMDDVINEINTAANFYKEDFPTLENRVHEAADFIQGDLPSLEEDFTNSLNLIEAKMPQLESTITFAADIVRNELDDFNINIINASDKVTEWKESNDLEDLIHILRRDVGADSNFMAEPVLLNTVDLFPISNYGSASSPFYTALCLWVGGLLVISLLSTEVKDMSNEIYEPHHFYFGRYLTFMAISLVQSLIVSLGNIFLLGVDIQENFYFILFSIFIGFVFMTIIYSLVAIFGNIGKGIAIIFLVLQISSSGGNFPIEVSSPFFQHIYPFLPFTYAVKLLREAVGGIVWINATQDIIVLLIFGALFIVLGTVLKKPLMKFVDKFNEDAHKSKIVH